MYKSGVNRTGDYGMMGEPVKKMGQTMMAGPMSYKKNANIDNIRGKMQKEAQENLKSEFDRMTRDKKSQIDRLDNMNNEMDKQIDELSDKKENLHQEVI